MYMYQVVVQYIYKYGVLCTHFYDLLLVLRTVSMYTDTAGVILVFETEFLQYYCTVQRGLAYVTTVRA
jgi:hypothetical protein